MALQKARPFFILGTLYTASMNMISIIHALFHKIYRKFLAHITAPQNGGKIVSKL